ncbi:uncharacterized protein BX664DRAFT_332022 [Halteromyces radiatus]|uniref:uncharacterized protein n=1 Tax=Halteromyces radiatus TaxID=101107 RepID=UPI00221E3CBB|nr:uncharacterized protein BX664DRAFT_332022 [Halteromyces radiatus]KAI8089038.1 hypothetical protein BX664DRAFT_332022 [Halteromyces radiatus]
MKFTNIWLMMLIGALFLIQYIHASVDLLDHHQLSKRAFGSDLLKREIKQSTDDQKSSLLVKRCNLGGHHKRGDDNDDDSGKHDGGLLDLECILGNVVDLVESLLGQEDNDDEKADGLVKELVQLVRQLLHTLNLGDGLDIDGLLGGLLGGGEHFDDDDDFGCGCDGDHDALVAHLIKQIRHVLDSLLGCDDDHNGLINQLVQVVNGLLSSCEDGHLLRRSIIKKRCDGGGLLDLNCLLDNVVDLVESILGGLGDDDDDKDGLGGLIKQLLQVVRKLLHTLGLADDDGLDLDGLLGGLLGGDHDDDDDFGCGCDGDNDALVAHLIKLVRHLLDQILGCSDEDHLGLVPRLVELVKDLLSSCEDHGDGDSKDNDHGVGKHHGHDDDDGKDNGHGIGKGHGHDEDDGKDSDRDMHKDHGHHGDDDDDECHGGLLNLDCLLDTVVDLVNSILGGEHHHDDDDEVSDLVHQVLKVVRRLLKGLNLNGTLKLDGLLGGDHDDDDDFGCGCDGDDDALVSHLVKTVKDLLDQLAGCKDDDGLIARLIKGVNNLLDCLLDSKDKEDKLRKRFIQRKRSTFGKRDLLDVGLVKSVLDTVQGTLASLLGKCDDDSVLTGLIDKVTDGVQNILDCLDSGELGPITQLVKDLVKFVSNLLHYLTDDDSLDVDDLVSQLVDAITDLVSVCNLLSVIDVKSLLSH